MSTILSRYNHMASRGQYRRKSPTGHEGGRGRKEGKRMKEKATKIIQSRVQQVASATNKDELKPGG